MTDLRTPLPPLRRGKDPDESLAYPGHGYRHELIGGGVTFERDVAVKLRDGTTIYVDVFRPEAEGQYPVVLGWAPFGKYAFTSWDEGYPGADIPPGISRHTPFEAVDPMVWVPLGFVVVNADPRGASTPRALASL